MSQTLSTPAFAPTPMGEIDDDKVTSMLATFFSNNWIKACNGDVKAAVELQHYASRASQYDEHYEATNKILSKMNPEAADKLRQAIETGSVLSFEP